MTLKYSIFNVSYQQPFDFQPIEVKHHRTISRYSDYAKKNKFNDSDRQDSRQIGRILPIDSPKMSLYQQYKNRQMKKKMKMDNNQSHERHYHSIIVRGSIGSIKTKARTEYEPQRNLLTPEGIQPLHSYYKPQTPNIRRRFSMSLNSQRCNYIQQNLQQSSQIIGVQGVKTSFLDKYKLKLAKQKQEFEENEKSKKFTRRQILCSTKRNRSIQPSLLTTRNKQKKNNKDQGNINKLNNQRQDKIQCRPWSPSKDQQFQKI